MTLCLESSAPERCCMSTSEAFLRIDVTLPISPGLQAVIRFPKNAAEQILMSECCIASAVSLLIILIVLIRHLRLTNIFDGYLTLSRSKVEYQSIILINII